MGDERMINWLRGKNLVHLDYYSWHHILFGRFRLQLYSPYAQEGLHQTLT